ncbi:MAG: hypothetical protein J07HQX50_00533 [Haloquadratum sp. J07HQX50]|nr:MAG: hypothetical protein J07HQX50_00533 [Haloquadratum sp. J07HQX50]
MTASPVIDAEFSFGYDSTDGGPVTLAVKQELVLRSISEDETEITEYWRKTKSMGGGSATDVSPGETMTVPFKWNVSKQYLRGEEISGQLGGAPGSTQLLVVSTVQMEGTVNGQPVAETAQYRMPVEVSASTFQPASVQGSALTGSSTTQITRQQTYGPLWRFGGPVAIAIGMLGGLSLLYIRVGTELLDISQTEDTFVTFQSARNEFSEWITTAELPGAATDRPAASVETLEGLVDTAIDMNSRVLKPPGKVAFYVLDADLVYVYRPPPAVRSMIETDSDSRTSVPESPSSAETRDVSSTTDDRNSSEPTDGWSWLSQSDSDEPDEPSPPSGHEDTDTPSNRPTPVGSFQAISGESRSSARSTERDSVEANSNPETPTGGGSSESEVDAPASADETETSIPMVDPTEIESVDQPESREDEEASDTHTGDGN